MEKYIYAKDVLLITQKKNYSKNILNIAQPMNQFV